MTKIDLNADLGESFGPWTLGNDTAMMDIVSSVNVACGGHAGDTATMRDSVAMAKDKGVTIGAHPGFVDKENFGRRRLPLTPDEIERLVAAQTGALCGIAALVGAEVKYVKAHGALGNWGAAERDVADAIARATQAVLGSNAALLAISGTQLEHAGKALGIPTYSEIFADRGYTPEGQLVPRGEPGAMIEDADEAAQRLINFFGSGEMPTVGGAPVRLNAQSICIHGDGPTAVEVAQGLRAALEDAGFSIGAFKR